MVSVSTILGEASNSLAGNSNLIGKVYFPRLVIPSSSAVVALLISRSISRSFLA
jgi:lipopolysaccharide transport system permease protein